MQNEYYTIREAAKILRRHPKTVWRWTVEGKIRFYQAAINCSVLIPADELKRLRILPMSTNAPKCPNR